VLKTLQQAVGRLDVVVVALEPHLLHPSDAVALYDEFERAARLAAAGKALLAARASEANEWARQGCRSPEDWFARKNGTGTHDAGRLLNTSERLKTLPKTQAALRNGELSEEQAAEIADAADESNEESLLGAARTAPLPGLKRRCNEERAKKRTDEQEAARRERVHRNRFFRSWNDADGSWRCEGSLTPAAGARIDAAVAAMAEVVFKETRAAGDAYGTAANYRADALERLVCHGGAKVDTTVVVKVDAADLAAERPSASDGLGAILAGAFVKIIVSDGTDVTKVVHWGRHIPSEVKTAIVERDGGRCVRPGCDSTHRLEIHHYQRDFAKGGATAYWNLATLCHHDHDLVTTGGHRLAGEPGEWRWCEPR
jgi:uncharacterized protein DUF222